MINYRCGFLIVLMFVLPLVNSYSQDEASVLKLGEIIPDFKLDGVDKSVSTADLNGKVILINFFATWCPPCRKELPSLEKEVWLKFKDNPAFKLLVVGREHSVEEMRSFSEGKFTMPFFGDKDRAVYSLFAENTIPRNYIINKKGEVIYASSGYSEESFAKMIRVLVNELK